MLPDVQLTELDGVPVVLVPSPGPPRCALSFRVGRSDETLTTSGVTHVVEHLVMHGVGRTPYEANAFVDPLRTVFTAAGRPEDLAAFLPAVARAVADPPLDRLEAERRVLLTEAARRGSTPTAELLTYRFGPRSYGLPAYDEHGLDVLNADDVAGWLRARFTRQNAVLWTTAPLPAGLRLDLPDGERLPPVEPHSNDVLPARFEGTLAVGLDVVAEASPALSAAWRLLQDRAFELLRREHAVVYDVDVDADDIGRRHRRYSLLPDPTDDQRYRAGQLLAAAVARLLDDGVTDAEVRDDVRATLSAWDDPAAAAERADRAALDVLLEQPVRSSAELEERVRALTAADVTDALREAHASALYALPDEVFTSQPLAPVSRWSSRRVTGHTFWRPGEESGDADRVNRHSLTVGADGVTRDVAQRQWVTVAYDRCAAVLAWHDGTRVLVGDDGFRVVVEPWEWARGQDVVEAVDAGAPAALVVDMGEGEGPPPPPPSATGRRRRGVLGLVLWGLLSLVFATFAFSATEPSDVPGAGPLASLGCDRGSSLEVYRKGPGPEVAQGEGPDFDRLRAACEEAAGGDVWFSGLGGLSLLACAGVSARRVARSRREGASGQRSSSAATPRA